MKINILISTENKMLQTNNYLEVHRGRYELSHYQIEV